MHAIQLFISVFNLFHSLLHVSVITENILITIIRFASYYLLLISNNTFMIDSQYLGTIQIWQNLNEYHFYLISTKFVLQVNFQIDSSCFPFKSLNMFSFNLYSLITYFSKYYIKTGKLCLLFWSSHVFTTSKIVKAMWW